MLLVKKQRSCAGSCRSYIAAILFAAAFFLAIHAPRAWAGGPRFVSGSGIWIQPGQPEGWSTSQLTYFTDPGSLSSSVSHVQADAMVAAAAAVWNVPGSSISLVQGGGLAEHVSGANSYFNGTDLVFPADVQTSNEAAMPVAVIYDTDGSVTDLLLGAGSSESLECLQNAVTQSVDDIQPDGHIHHATVVLNGKCVGSTPEQLTQMQYQLARAFGRVLGLAWSQTNDNVFTAASQINIDEETYWPLMHPLDVICGTYTYQCMQNPFTLRPDDLSGLAALYPVLANAVPAGKQASDTDAAWLFGISYFPTGQGMDWQNLTARRQRNGVMEDFEIVSAITGTLYQQTLASPVTGTQVENSGIQDPIDEGIFSMRVVPIGGLANVFMTSEPINPLYSGEYALGPYARPPVRPSGSPQTLIGWSVVPSPDNAAGFQSTAWDAASSCAPGPDGSENAPAALSLTGWQTGQICGWGHNSWLGATVRAGRSWTLEVTATDETGAPTDNKLQPVVGIWKAADATGTLPTVASAAVPFNSMAYGVTQLHRPSSASDTPLRFVVGDEFGGGRPDFTYTARLLYADNVSPASIGSGGGTVTITGTGFRQGNAVKINGIAANVQSWTATQIVAVAPAASFAGAVAGRPVTVSVVDATTGGSTAIARALTYTQAPDLLQVVSAPASLETDVTAAVPFAVKVLASDGITPVAGAAVSFSVSANAGSLGTCGKLIQCTAVTDSNGIVQTTVAGDSLATAAISAIEMSGGATIRLVLAVTAPVRSASLSSSVQYAAEGANGSWTLSLSAVQDGVPASGVPVTWSVSPGLTLVPGAAATGAPGTAAVTVSGTALVPGSVNSVTGCAWATYCATWTLNVVAQSEWRVTVANGAGQSVAAGGTLVPVGLLVQDSAGHALQGAPVALFQRVLGWEGLCASAGACPAAPVLASSQATVTSDSNGMLSATPLQVAGVPQTVEIAASTGSQGFVTLTLVKSPSP